MYSALELNHMLISCNWLPSRQSTVHKESLSKNKELSRQTEGDRTTGVHTTLGTMWTHMQRRTGTGYMSQSVQCGQKGRIRQEFPAENVQM